MNKKTVKKYFSKKDTAYIWWDPHNSDKREIYLRQEKVVKKIVDNQNPKKIIDISSGRGRYALLLHKGRDYTCLDISKQMLNHVKKLNLHIRLIQGDAERIPLKEKFDLILCSEALVHYPYPEKALKEMKRILSKKGSIIITVDNRLCLGKIIRMFANFISKITKKEINPLKNDIYQPYTNQEYKRMFSNQKLQIHKTIRLSILTTPIKNNEGKYILPPNISKNLLFIDYFLEKIPLVNKLSTYFIYILKHE
jgi:ubiquinone/menaquinone biosynthesis C-methylase UbiE